jgi:hypothetical protein
MTLDESRPSLLKAMPGFDQLSELDRFIICNGCGKANSKFDFIPDTIYLLPISEACDRHDFAYHIGKTEADREAADEQFLDNLLTLIEDHTRIRLSQLQGWYYGPMRGIEYTLRAARRWRAMSYYSAVRDMGGAAFWAGKVRAA